MTRTELIDQIRVLAGCQRDKTFPLAAEYALDHGFCRFVETGCYRGNDADGQSTVILGMLAKETTGWLDSLDINPESIKLAREKAQDFLGWLRFIEGDSVFQMSKLRYPINFAYLDSYDFHNDNPGPAQRHQLAEVGALLGKMTRPGLILLDDCDLPCEHGGKGGLSSLFLDERGWKLLAKGYQRLYVQE